MDRDWEFGTCPGSDDSDFFDWEVVEGRRRGWGGGFFIDDDLLWFQVLGVSHRPTCGIVF